MRKAFVRKLTELAEKDKDVILLTGDLGFSLFEEFKERFPKQFLNVGLSEQCMIGMAAGLALEGKKVFVYSIIPFLIYRAFEQIRNDLCYQKLRVKLIGAGSGFVYGGQGGTHHAIEDLGVVTSLPDMMVFAPSDPLEVEKIVENSLSFDLPCYMRLNRVRDSVIHSENSIKNFKIGSPLEVKGDSNNIVIFALGNMLLAAVEISNILEYRNIKNSVYSVHTLKPVNKNDFVKIMKDSEIIVTLEEHIDSNSLKAIINNIIVEYALAKKVLSFDLPDKFIHIVGSQTHLRKQFGLTNDEISKRIIGEIS